jgi:hypothetical protein
MSEIGMRSIYGLRGAGKIRCPFDNFDKLSSRSSGKAGVRHAESAIR